jgi:hypothetical protein
VASIDYQTELLLSGLRNSGTQGSGAVATSLRGASLQAKCGGVTPSQSTSILTATVMLHSTLTEPHSLPSDMLRL